MRYAYDELWLNPKSNTRHLARARVRRSAIGMVWLEVHLQRQLRLPRRSGLLKLPEPRVGVGRVGAGTEDVVDVGKVRAVEEIEDFNDGLDIRSAANADPSADAHVDGGLRRQRARVPANTGREISRCPECAIGAWNRAAVTVLVQIGTGKNIVRPARFDPADRRDIDVVRCDIYAAHDQPMSLILQ